MTVLSCKGFQARITFNAADGLLVGRIAAITDVVGFHADSVAALKAAFEAAVDDYVETCERYAKLPERQFSGRVTLRLSSELHASAALAAELRGMSLRRWLENAIGTAAEVDLGAP